DAVLLAAHPVDVAGDRLIVLLETRRRLRRVARLLVRAGLFGRPLAIGLAARITRLGGHVAGAADLLLQRLQRLIELVQRTERLALPAGVECIEVGPLGVHRGAVFRNGWLVARFLSTPVAIGAAGHSAQRFENREKIRYRMTTGNRHAHNSPDMVNNALTKLKNLQGLFR